MGMDNVDLLFLRRLQKKLRIEAVYKELLQDGRQIGLRIQRQSKGRVAGIKPFYALDTFCLFMPVASINFRCVIAASFLFQP
jgi:hypothetical protein